MGYLNKRNTNYDVSVIIPTYNPNIEKLFLTIMSIIEQKGVLCEIIISDDGSPNFPKNIIERFFEQYGFQDYIININDNNLGTVSNIKSAFGYSCGEYISLISPGDLLFDINTLATFYNYAKTNNLDICFGNAVHYCGSKGNYSVIESKIPCKPNIYNHNNKLIKEVAAHMRSNSINGTSYLRKKDSACKIIDWVSYYSKYVEDTTSLRYYLAYADNIAYLPRNFTWYERGGVSTSFNTQWAGVLEKDIETCYEGLSSCFPNDAIIDFFSRKNSYNNYNYLFYGLIRHPIVIGLIIYVYLYRDNTRLIMNTNYTNMINDKIDSYQSFITEEK